MGLRVSFELDDVDLKHFRLIMREARKTLALVPPEDIVAAAEAQLGPESASAAPGFVRERLEKLRLLIRMLTDLDWQLPHEEAQRVLNALAYFTEPEDLIPDHIPGLGFLDDAIMVELVARELRHEIDAYQDFCRYRAGDSDARPQRSSTRRGDELARRRAELHARIRRRREKRAGSAGKDVAVRLFD